MFRSLFLVTIAALAIADHAAAQTARCGGKIVQVGMTADEVLKYCGPPTRKEVEEHDVRSGGRVVGVTYLHRWYYDRGFTGKPKVLEFDQDKLIAIK